MDQLSAHLDKTFSAAIVMDLKEIAYGTGLVSMVENRVVVKPLYHWLLRVQQSEVPKPDPFNQLPEGQWLPIIEGPVHWTHLDTEAAPTTLVDGELGKHDVLLSVKNLHSFIIKAEKVEEVFNKLLQPQGITPYHVDTDKGFSYYHIPVDDVLQRQIEATEKFSAIGDLYRAEWLWKNHPAYSKFSDQPLLTAAFSGAYNAKTNKGEIYFSIYRGQVSMSDGGRLRFWDQEMELIDTGLLVRQGKNLFFVDVPYGSVAPLDMTKARPVYQFKNKNAIKQFLKAAAQAPLGSWHTSLQYVDGAWYNDGRELSKRLENKLMANIATIVDLGRQAAKELPRE